METHPSRGGDLDSGGQRWGTETEEMRGQIRGEQRVQTQGAEEGTGYMCHGGGPWESTQRCMRRKLRRGCRAPAQKTLGLGPFQDGCHFRETPQPPITRLLLAHHRQSRAGK